MRRTLACVELMIKWIWMYSMKLFELAFSSQFLLQMHLQWTNAKAYVTLVPDGFWFRVETKIKRFVFAFVWCKELLIKDETSRLFYLTRGPFSNIVDLSFHTCIVMPQESQHTGLRPDISLKVNSTRTLTKLLTLEQQRERYDLPEYRHISILIC